MQKLFSLSIIMLFSAFSLLAQHKTPTDRKSPHETVKGKYISITYGRPYKKGRDIFGGLVPYGQVWRAGADEATEITINKPVTFADERVSNGTYTLFVIPNADKWTVILNKKLGQWGAFGYDKVKDQDVLHADVSVKHLDKPVEQFTITPTNDGFRMEWDKTSVFVPIQVK